MAKARAFQRKHPYQIKVLPRTGPEVRNFVGLDLPERPVPIDAAVLQQITDTLLHVVRESNDPDARADALGLLTDLGEVAA